MNNTIKSIVSLCLAAFLLTPSLYAGLELLGEKTAANATAPEVAASKWTDVETNHKGWDTEYGTFTIGYKDEAGEEQEIKYWYGTADRFLHEMQKLHSQGLKVHNVQIKQHAGQKTQYMSGRTEITVTSGGQIRLKLLDRSYVDVTQLFRETLVENANVEFNGCNTAKGDDNITKRMSLLFPKACCWGSNSPAENSVLIWLYCGNSESRSLKRAYINGKIISDSKVYVY